MQVRERESVMTLLATAHKKLGTTLALYSNPLLRLLDAEYLHFGCKKSIVISGLFGSAIHSPVEFLPFLLIPRHSSHAC